MEFKDGGSATAAMKNVADDGDEPVLRVVLAVNPGFGGDTEVFCTAANARSLALALNAAADRLDKYELSHPPTVRVRTRKPAR